MEALGALGLWMRKENPRLLELFCGGKSVGKAAAKWGYDVISVDILQRFKPTICCDLLDFDFQKYPVGYIKYIHASPPCTEFSIAKTVGVRKIDEATKLVLKALAIIDYLKPVYWTLENPRGLLRAQPCMAPYKMYLTEVSYCKYGFRYRKNTDLWTNIPYQPRSLCLKGTYCKDKMLYKFHRQTVQKGPSELKHIGVNAAPTKILEDRYALPEELLTDLFKAAKRRARTRWWLPYRKGIEWWRNAMLYEQTDSDTE